MERTVRHEGRSQLSGGCTGAVGQDNVNELGRPIATRWSSWAEAGTRPETKAWQGAGRREEPRGRLADGPGMRRAQRARWRVRPVVSNGGLVERGGQSGSWQRGEERECSLGCSAASEVTKVAVELDGGGICWSAQKARLQRRHNVGSRRANGSRWMIGPRRRKERPSLGKARSDQVDSRRRGTGRA
ncbi:hypothetical protein IQ07DRAFT_600808 [Pyrenochaeta sp. DS3sAY3a]|nr:hypothetical protein IQ07DRAFT_600808 [Pyrenochaeta sp. DS3sAY3a]